MAINLNHYTLFAEALEYPDKDYTNEVHALQQLLTSNYPEAAKEFAHFNRVISHADLRQLEELYTRTFDVQALTTLDIGYLLFGEDYKRGKFLVNLNREMREAGIDCKGQLSDYLPNVLRLINRMEKENLRDELVVMILIPSINKILNDFTPERINMKQKIYKKHQKTLLENPTDYPLIYYFLFSALVLILNEDFNTAAKKAVVHEYEKDINQELKNG